MRGICGMAVAVVLGLSLTVVAGELQSGPSKCVPFDVKAITGAEKGNTLCYFCKYSAKRGRPSS